MTPAAQLQAAAEVLDRMAGGRASAEQVLKDWGRTNRYAGSKDRRAIADRVFRVLRSRARLAWAAGAEDGRSLVLWSLVLLDGVAPDYLEKYYFAGGYGPAPLTNAERARLAAPPVEPPAWAGAGVPEFVADDFQRRFGADWTVEAAALTAPRAPVDVRVNGADRASVAAELQAAELEAEETPWSACGLRLGAGADVQGTAPWREGRVEVQDEGSQVAAWLAGARPGELVVDYCAGGGGKTLALAQSMGLSRPSLARHEVSKRRVGSADGSSPPAGPLTPGPSPARGEGRLVACDVEARRLEAVRPRLVRAGVEAELRRLGPEGEGVADLEGRADLVFVDAPCSGAGTWRRRPEAPWRLTAEEVERLHGLQVAILGWAAKLVRPGGRLVYVTCSVLGRENEDSAAAFAEAHGGFRPVPVAEAAAQTPGLTGAGRTRLAELAGGGHQLQLTPARTGTDGFFVALWRRADQPTTGVPGG